MRVPLLSKLDFSLIKDATKTLKGFGYVYAMYLSSWTTATFLPRFMMTRLVSETTRGFTAAFSNVRGPAKQMYFCPE